MPCYRCERVQTDPVRGPSDWIVGVVSNEQVLLCPNCRADDPDWVTAFQTCEACGGTRLRVMLGSIVCRACGHDQAI